ncbi:unnamed protein product [Soboliphyme baturini]|uniref:Ovule protein n=1 Tax=Soboliphyme baturini TaxID=241478 RepID=A0A183IJP3_9BILA|nr:unnamed protein product [Soboliphyme baturini]
MPSSPTSDKRLITCILPSVAKHASIKKSSAAPSFTYGSQSAVTVVPHSESHGLANERQRSEQKEEHSSKFFLFQVSHLLTILHIAFLPLIFCKGCLAFYTYTVV